MSGACAPKRSVQLDPIGPSARLKLSLAVVMHGLPLKSSDATGHKERHAPPHGSQSLPAYSANSSVYSNGNDVPPDWLIKSRLPFAPPPASSWIAESASRATQPLPLAMPQPMAC